LPARAAVQLAQADRRVEPRQPALHAPQLGERRRARVEAFLLRAREYHHVDRLPHYARPAIDEHVVRAPPRQPGDEYQPEAGPEGVHKLTSVHTRARFPG